MRPRHFEDIFKCISLNENVQIPTKLSLKFVPNVPAFNSTALVQIMVGADHINVSLGLSELITFP